MQVNPRIAELRTNGELTVRLEAAFEAELDEQWSYVANKSNPRWLWYVVDYATNTVLAYIFGKRKDEVFKKLKQQHELFCISHYYTDDWGAYERHTDTEKHEVGEGNTQKIERKYLTIESGLNVLIEKRFVF